MNKNYFFFFFRKQLKDWWDSFWNVIYSLKNKFYLIILIKFELIKFSWNKFYIGKFFFYLNWTSFFYVYFLKSFLFEINWNNIFVFISRCTLWDFVTEKKNIRKIKQHFKREYKITGKPFLYMYSIRWLFFFFYFPFLDSNLFSMEIVLRVLLLLICGQKQN